MSDEPEGPSDRHGQGYEVYQITLEPGTINEGDIRITALARSDIHHGENATTVECDHIIIGWANLHLLLDRDGIGMGDWLRLLDHVADQHPELSIEANTSHVRV